MSIITWAGEREREGQWEGGRKVHRDAEAGVQQVSGALEMRQGDVG